MINGCSLCQICVESEVSAKPTSNERMTTASRKNNGRRSEKTMGNDTATRHTPMAEPMRKLLGYSLCVYSSMSRMLTNIWWCVGGPSAKRKRKKKKIVGEDAKHKARTSHTKKEMCVFAYTHSNPVECTRHRINEMAVNVDD